MIGTALSHYRVFPAVMDRIDEAGMGDNDRAFEWLERAYEEREGVLVFLRAIVRLMPSINSDRRLADLLRRIGLPE